MDVGTLTLITVFLTGWVSGTLGEPAPTTVPSAEVYIVSERTLTSVVCESDARPAADTCSRDVRVAGAYFPGTGRILIREDLTERPQAFGMYLVHELVHYFQDGNAMSTCERERQAYNVQLLYGMRTYGLTLIEAMRTAGLTPESIAAGTGCDSQ